jgi:hypothetical protein
MALAATVVLELRTTGSDTNGGGFKTGASGTDWSQQDAAQYAVADAVTNGTTTITSATANFGTDVVGNLLYIVGGTGSITGDWYEITARTDSSTITVDRSTGLTSGTDATLNIGGALVSPGQTAAVANKTAGIDVWQKAGTYTLTSSTANIAGGRVNLSAGGASAANVTKWEGYQTTRGDKGTRPVISAGAVTSVTLFTAAQLWVVVDNLIFDGNSGASTTGFSVTASRTAVRRLHAQNTTAKGLNLESGCFAYRCTATGCSGTSAIHLGNVSGQVVMNCEAYGNTIHGFNAEALNWTLIRCISSGNTGGSTDGFVISSTGSTLESCVAYGNGRHGFSFSPLGTIGVTNCVAEGNTNTGFKASSVGQNIFLANCAAVNNSTANYDTTNLPNRTDCLTGSASYFTDPGSGDFSLNNTAGGGAAARAAGTPGVMPRGTTTGYRDIGVAQHQDAGGSGGGDLFGGGLVH